MRLMSDVDILFKDEQSKRIKELMLKLGFNIYHLGGNHDVYTKEPYISIEMHRRLVDKSSSYSEYLGNTWDRAQPKKGSIFIRMLSHEDLFIYMLIHIAKHFLNGGTGVRSIIDIHLYKKNYDVNMDWNYIWYELDKIKLRRFTESIITLGDIWFGDCQSNNLYDYLTDYILSSGAYGTKENARLSAMAAGIKSGKVQSAQNIGHGRLHYIRKLFFPPIDKIQFSYPILEKIPFLLPFCWMLRGISCLLFKQKRTFKIIGGINTVSDDDVNKLRDLYDGIGILNGVNKWLSDKQIIDN